ncbi:MAG: DUF4157 domain-containing protein [Cyanobacteriota bacterium]|nr:DUF4157 domain-containing protein [Cyanobacteriota bacterium]
MTKQQKVQKKALSSTTSTPSSAEYLQTRPFAPVNNSTQASPIQKQSHNTSLIGHSFSNIAVQPKLKIGEPGDKYEQEADKVAAQVVQQINEPTTQREELPEEEELQMKPETGKIQREEMPEEEELQMKPETIQRQSNVDSGTASNEFESSLSSARSGGQSLQPELRMKLEGAMGADFSGVKVHTDAKADQLNQSIQAKAFTTGQDVFFRQGEYNPQSQGGQELIAHELTHVVQQGGEQIQTMLVQRTPEDVWNRAETLPQVNEKDAKKILIEDFYSNWFLAQDYLLNPQKWTKHGKTEQDAQTHGPAFKGLMKTLLKLRETETNQLLTDVKNELKQKDQFKNLSDDEVLKWSAAGSQSLTSDIDVNLKGAGSIEAVGLFNKYFKTNLGWSLDAGTVYDVNVYAQDFMTPHEETGVPFEKEKGQNPITPVQEVKELNAGNNTESLAFDAFSLNQDVWSLVKMRIYMSNNEWNAYMNEMLENARGNGSDDELARELQVKAQFEDAEEYYQEYENNLKVKIEEIEKSSDNIYQNMRNVLVQGNSYLSEHQQEASKKMIAANLIYEEKLKEVSVLRQQLQDLKTKVPQRIPEIKQAGIQLKNALSEAIIYSNEAYFTQGAVHFAVIGQQIGKGESKLIMSDDEHLHSFREQVGDTLKVLGEYAKSPIDKAIFKAGKYIDRLAKSAIPLLEGGTPPNGYKELAEVGAAAAKLKGDKTKKEELNDKSSKEQLNEQDSSKLNTLTEQVTQQENLFPQLARLNFETVPELRATVIAVGKQIEKDFRQKQQQNNSQNQGSSQLGNQNQEPQLNEIQNNIENADREVGCFSGLLAILTSCFQF